MALRWSERAACFARRTSVRELLLWDEEFGLLETVCGHDEDLGLLDLWHHVSLPIVLEQLTVHA